MGPRRSLQTILFTDIVGSTERATELGDREWRAILDEHHASVRREIRRCGGREVKSTGDGFLAAFPQPAQALQCAWSIRDALHEIDLTIRCGIHMGAVEHQGRDLGGIAVHVGARIEGAAEPDEILVSNAVRESELGSGFEFEDRGKRDLKGIEGEWRLFSLEACPPASEGIDGRMEGSTRRRVALLGLLAALIVAAGVYVLVLDHGASHGPAEAIAAPLPAIAVLPFRVGHEDLSTWREGMVDLLSTNLDGIPGLRAIDSHTMLARWNEVVEGESMPDRDSALEIARFAEARYAIHGRVVAAGERLRVIAELYDVDDGATLSRAQVEGVVDSIFGLVDRLSIELVRGIVESEEDLAGIDLARTTTDTLDALLAYLEGEIRMRRGDWILAVEAYERAVASDSTFALAWLQLSVANGWGMTEPGASHDRMVEASERALRYHQRLPEREALLVRGWAFTPHLGIPAFASDRMAGLEALVELTRKYPDDVLGWFLRGDFAFHLEGPLLRDPDEDRDAFEQAIRLDPGFAPSYNHYISDIMRTDPDSARVSELMAIQDRLGAPGADERRIVRTLAFGEPDERGPAIAALDTVSDGWACTLCIANLFFTHPRYLEIQTELLRAAVREESWEPLIAAPWLLRTLLSRGRLSDAVEAAKGPIEMDELLYLAHASGYPIPSERLEAALGPEPEEPGYMFPTSGNRLAGSMVVQHVFRGAWALERNRREVFQGSLAALRSLERRWSSDADSLMGSLTAGYVKGGIDALQGFRAWREGRTEAAAELLDRARLRTTADWYPVNLAVRWWLARMALEAEELEETSVYLLSLSHAEAVKTDPWATLQLARLQEELGLHYDARANYEFFALAWKDADPRFQPLVQQARQSAIRLRGLQRE